MWKRLAVAGACALATSAVGLPAAAQDGFVTGVAPPAPRYEAVPPPRPGYEWAPGHWAWRDGRYVWIDGRWIDARPGFYYHPDRWEYSGGRWHLVPGGWSSGPYLHQRDFDLHRDRDGDLIPDRFDPDYDNDGTPNRWDAYPNNPRWR
jgi:hypothetical protein